MAERRYIPVKGIPPNSRFANELNKDVLLRTMECVWAMHLERLYGVRYEVKFRLVPAGEQEDAGNE